MRPEIIACARAHVPGVGPVAIEAIAGGEMNETFHVEREGRAYSLRVRRPAAAELELDRAFECRVITAAAAAGIAPPLVRCVPERGILVLAWEAGRRWSSAEARTSESLARIAALVRRVQALAVPSRPVARSVAEWIAHYARLDAGALRQHPLLSEHRAALEHRLRTLEQLPPEAPRLCHGDLHRDNLIDGAQGLRLIDWEYAHLADPLWDLAAWASSLDLGPDEVRRLLHAYRGRPPFDEDELRLELLRWLYDYLCLLWSVLTGTNAPAGTGTDPVAALAERLRREARSLPGGRRGQT